MAHPAAAPVHRHLSPDGCRVISIRVAAVATQIIGATAALLALLCPTGSAGHDFGIGITIIAAGLAVWLAVGWWEHRR